MVRKLMALVMALVVVLASCSILTGCKEGSSSEGTEPQRDAEDEGD